MNLDQYFLALSFGYLKATSEKAKDLSAFLKALPYDFEHPKAIGKYSLGGESPDQKSIGFLEWANRLRLEGILGMSVESINQTELADHISAGFTNGIHEMLTVQTKRKTHTFALIAFNSTSTEATAKEFFEILNAQKDIEKIKSYLYDELSEFLKLNQISYNPKDSFEELLFAHERNYWNALAGRLIQEMQIELAALGHQFIVPETLREFLIQYNHNTELDEPPLATTRVYFYALRDVTADQIIKLVELQTESDFIRKQAQAHQSMYEMNLEINFASDEWKQQLHALSAEKLKIAESILSRSIADECEKRGTLPIIPEDLVSFWGPNESEFKRIKFRGQIQMNGYYFTQNKNPWSFYQFKEVTSNSSNSMSDRTERESLSHAIEKYQLSLDHIFHFSEKAQTPFAEAFKAGLFLLTHDLPTISFHNSEGRTVLKEFLNMNGYSQNAQEIIVGKSELFEDLRQLQLEPLEFRCWCSFEITSVFGGMGSWNDLSFKSSEETTDYNQLTDDFYKSRQNLFLSLLNY